MTRILLEVCVDTIAGLDAAVAGGADRVELCSALDVGGLTPSVGMMAAVAECGRPVFAMIRPRAGDFVFSAAEVRLMCRDIAAARSAGLQGVVLGASRPDGRLDDAVLSDLRAASDGMGLTLHRAFDLVPDVAEALEMAVDLGFDRILTSGQARTAPEGAGTLARIFDLCRGRIAVMPGAGITAATVGALRHLPLTEVHASCAAPVPGPGLAVTFGFASAATRQTDPAAVAALRSALAH